MREIDAMVREEANLDLVPDVDDESTGDRLHRDPVVTLAHLKAFDVVVGEQDRHPSGVGVGREAEGEIRLRAFGVVVDPQASASLSKGSVEELFVQS